ncbi:Putative dystroglycan-type cadherin, immunoglobulin-like, Cadherin-like superfamily [Colletotrichum destructivum]|uniref:Dystroglycan-type cadherin, immunoglobulin-like, Cadherin-like superfamily n=1 Tax=Colletotrichum destructivum TaxID=34406 RepID=A0AAX4IZK1_9PEZI|nr:Putative dystroglycan-type cadherin, immunoglobulin-like, Cadherin-like superfamily [Colletotrichum destructivum]
MPLISYNASAMALYAMLYVFPFLAVLAEAVPVVYFPFNSQLPPATRISEPFSYTLSPQTFASQYQFSYSLRNAPSWLSIDANTGRLFGTPQDDDVPPGEVVGIPVDIIATDSSGSATMTATLVVTRRPTPRLNKPLSEQIQQFGETASPSAVVAFPASDFSFSFAKDTFSYAGNGLNYYATSANNSPLPSWIKFDATSLTFTGKTPPFESLVQPPQKFDFSLVGSDIVGFSAVSVVFSIIVGTHRLTTDTPVIRLNATQGTKVSYTALANSIKSDGNAVVPADLNLTTSGLPSWLLVDDTTLEIQGNPPDNAQSSNSTLIFRDKYSSTLDILLSVTIVTKIFRNTNMGFEATPGGAFSFDIEPYLWVPSDTELEIDSPEGWIKLEGLVLSGTPPKTASPDNIKILVKATSKSSQESDTATVDLGLLPAPAVSSTTPTTSAKPTNPAVSDGSTQGLKAGYIALAILIPLLLLAIIVILIVCCRKRRRRDSAHDDLKSKISQPIPGTFVMNSGPHSRGGSDHSVVEMMKAPEANRRSRGYFNSAVQRMRQSRTLSTITGSRMSESNNRSSYLWRGSERSPTPRSPSFTSSWRTEGVLFQPQHAQQQSTSTYDGPSDLLSGSSGFLQGQRDDSFRSVLDITIPSMEDEPSSIQATPELAYTSPWGEPSRLALDRSLLLPAASGSDSLASIPEQLTPLGSNPTHGRRFSPSQRPRKRFTILNDSGTQSSFRSSRSGSGRGRLGRQGSEPASRSGSLSRPISRKSDSSPFFGGRSVVPSRNRYNLDSDDSDSLQPARGTENWQTIPPRDSLGIAYDELTRSSPFMRHTPSLSPRPLSIVKKDSGGPRYTRDSRVGKQTPLSRKSSSSSNIISGHWNRDSFMQQGAAASRPDYPSSRASSEVLGKGKGLARYSSGHDSEGSDWVTEVGTVGKRGPRSRLSSNEDFRVFM